MSSSLEGMAILSRGLVYAGAYWDSHSAKQSVTEHRHALNMLCRRRFALNPFTLKMMTIHRWFDITPAMEDLKYEPIYTTADAWQMTISWYKAHPEFLEKHAGIKAGKV